jgi:hypothetical protein
VFLEASFILFVTTYYKGYNFSKKVKAIYCYVLREVSKLVVYYLRLG